jgi:hypothetical protein
MKILTKAGFISIVCTLILASIAGTEAHATEETMKTFLDSEVPSIWIQVNATAETQPAKNMTVVLSLTTQTDVHVDHFNIDVFGFLNGTIRILIGNITEDDFSLNETSRAYNSTFNVPDNVWDATYGEISLAYSTTLGGLELKFRKMTTSFPMTLVENTYLKDLENRFQTLNESYQYLNDSFRNLTSTFDQLNQTYWQLYNNYTSMQGSSNDLDNTRRAAILLAITTVFFVATTIYLVTRKPRNHW